MKPIVLFTALAALFAALPAAGQLDPTCTVSALNRTVTVDAGGVWVLPNVPAGAGPVRLRATCIATDGTVRSGQSDFLSLPPNGILAVPEIYFDDVSPVPAQLALSAPGGSVLTTVGQSVDLQALATFAQGGSADVTVDPGTSWTVSNPRIATVSETGVVAALSSGTVVVSALHEGALGVLRLQVVLSGDTDGDGIPDDVEIANGLDPNDPVDGFEDPDVDALATSAEIAVGSDPLNPDTDGDTLLDGEEVNDLGTDPILADTDGDQFRDGLEVATASDPLDPGSFNLPAALATINVLPGEMTIVFNTVATEASRTVEVRGRLTDDTDLNLLEPRFEATFASSNLSVASFGFEPGRIFAGTSGTATVSASAGGRSGETRVRVETFSPRGLGSIGLTGAANGVAVSGTRVLVAAGGAGLHMVDVSDPSTPQWLATARLPGSAYDVRVAGSVAWVAAGSAGLLALDLDEPGLPIIGSLSVAGSARDLAVVSDKIFLVDAEVLTAIDVSDPTNPVPLGSLALPGGLRGVAAESNRALVTAGAAGVHVVDVSDPAAPVLVETLATRPEGRSSADDVAMRDGRAYVADGALEVGGLAVLDTSVADTPFLAGRSSDEFGLKDVALEGPFALAADYFYSNAVPIFNVAGPVPGFAALLDFGGNLQGQALAVENGFLYLVGSHSWLSFEDWGSCVLVIAQYARFEDPAPVPPRVRMLPLGENEQARERRRLTLRAEATDDFGVESVRFEVDGLTVGTDFESPWSVEITVPEGAELRARAVARDHGGLETVSTDLVVSIVADNNPSVRLLEPLRVLELAGGANYRYSAHASDDVRITGVEVLVDGAPLGSFTRRPYSGLVRVPATSTSLTFALTATDDLGQTSSETVTFPVRPNAVPRVAMVDPAPTDSVIAASRRRVLVGVIDEAPPVRVTLFLNGLEVGTRTEGPWEFEITAPTAGTELVLEATAADVFGQIGTTLPRPFPIVPDPGTTAVGSVETLFGDPVAGAFVFCEGVSGSTEVDGTFRIAGVPTIAEAVHCEARVGSGFEESAGSSAVVAPVPARETSVGPITIAPVACVVGRFEWEGTCFPVGPVTAPLELFVYEPLSGRLISLGDVPLDGAGGFCVNLRLGSEYLVEHRPALCPEFENGAICDASLGLFEAGASGLCGEPGAACATLGTVVVECYPRPVK